MNLFRSINNAVHQINAIGNIFNPNLNHSTD